MKLHILFESGIFCHNYSVSVVGGVIPRICIRLQPGRAVVDKINECRVETLLDVSKTP